MIPDLASVMRKRYRMVGNLRLAAVILLVVWVVYFGFSLARVMPVRRQLGMYKVYTELGASAVFLVGAVILGALSGRITRWILPIPKAGCPRCGYRLVALREPRCPECGLGLPQELMGP